MKKITVVVLVVVTLLFGTIAGAFIGSSNLGILGYPDHDCIQPIMPIERDSLSVSIFNDQLITYKRCIKDYVEAADNDKKLVIEKSNNAVDEFNNFISSIR